MKRDERGLSMAATILLVILIVLVAGLGWYIYKTGKKTTPSSTNTSSSADTSSAATDFVTISEWGVKVHLTDYDKVVFAVTDEPGQLLNNFQYDGKAVPTFKPEFLQDKSCTPGVSLYRSKTAPATSSSGIKKIGDYYYVISGGPGPCSTDPTNNPDDQLKTQFINEFKVNNLSAI